MAEIIYGDSNLIDAKQALSEVIHDASLSGKGTKQSPLKTSLEIDSDTLVGTGTAQDPLTTIPFGALLAEDGSPLLTEDGEFIILEGYVESTSILKYVALLSQSGTDAPTAIVLENTFYGPIVWSYNSSGDYTGILEGAFLQDKTWFSANTEWSSSAMICNLSRVDNDTIRMFVNDGDSTQTDDWVNISIEIRVYP